MRWIIDASVAMRWLLKDETHVNADKVLHHILRNPEEFAVPELFAFEVLAVLSRLHPEPLEAYFAGIIPVLQSGIFRQPMTETLASLSSKYIEMGLSGYDASYVALAQDLKAVWLTFDSKAHDCVSNTGLSCLLSSSIPHELRQ